MSTSVHPIHAGPRMTVLALAASISMIGLLIVVTIARFASWWMLGVLVVTEVAVYQAFSSSVRRRRRDLALLRCLGASRGQVFAGVLAEAVWIGIFGATAGLFVALLLVLDLGRVDVMLFGFVVGVLCAVIAALVPAIRATRIPPGGPS